MQKKGIKLKQGTWSSVSTMILMILIVMLFVSGYVLFKDYKKHQDDKKEYDELLQMLDANASEETAVIPSRNDTENDNTNDTLLQIDYPIPDPLTFTIINNQAITYVMEKIGVAVPPERFRIMPVEEIDQWNVDYSQYREQFPTLKEMNPDFVGWLNIPGTTISYPVVYSENSQTYLNTGFNGKQNNAGTLFITGSSGLSAQNIVIYGHRMRSGIMFCDLGEYKDKSFYNEHKTISWTTFNHSRSYKVFAVFSTNIAGKAFNYTQSNFPTKSDFRTFIDTAQKKSVIKTGVHVPDGAKILTLSTCEKGTNRLVVMAYYD